MTESKDLVIPSHLQIETINGVCTARCIMCTIESWKRKPNRMTEEEFETILSKFIPYVSRLDYLTLHGCGEALLDQGIARKVAFAKKNGFHGTGLATNCTELTERISIDLIEAGLDTIICSIDGIDQQTHESIRKRTSFSEVVHNAKQFIRIRNELDGKTRVLIRFIRQELNYDQWDTFYAEWSAQVSSEKGDDVIRFDMHNWGDKKETPKDMQAVLDHSLICTDLFERMLIYSNGDVGLCCADDDGFFEMGNVLTENPISIYNNDVFSKYRTMMQLGKIGKLEHCSHCTIPQSRANKTNPRIMKTD